MSRLAMPKPNIECVESRQDFGKFLAEPLEKGFGVTLGNSLRRVLLSYLPGAAVTAIRIEGIQHEFAAIPGVKEDVTEFILNVKELRLKPLSGQSGKLVLDVDKEGEVYAADIKSSTDFEIANPELYLVTMDSLDARLHVEFDVEIGEGYRDAGLGDNLSIGDIPVDAIFTPVRKVNFTTEPIHVVGQEASRERLCLEVWTDGTISSVDAVSRSASILVEQLTPFVNCAQVVRKEEAAQVVRLSIPEELYNMPVDKLNLSARTMNCLRRGSIDTVGQIMAKGGKGLMALRNFGRRSRQEVEEHLQELGLSLISPAEDVTKPAEEGSQDEA
ncbi:MAG: DNA-directed RNA polymerase subunit alpha [Dehalococcoidales bacterium]|nr:DNA-directed RNA polymerase subunit alpha [Dehalococcoidales bacterium]